MKHGAEVPVQKLKVGCFNTQSMCNKVSNVIEMMKDKAIDICCITETWFKAKENARFAEIHDFGFDVISVPRKGIGGGVGFIFNPSKVTVAENRVSGYKAFEVVEGVIKTANSILRICTVYRTTQKSKGRYQDTKVNTFLDEFGNYLDDLVIKPGYPILCGDFNFHVEKDNDPQAKRFITLYESKGWTQHSTEPTHKAGGTLDLVLTLKLNSEPISIQDFVVDTCSGTTSDHYLVSFKIPILPAKSIICKLQEKTVREFNRIDIDSFRENLFFSPLNMSDFNSVDHAVEIYNNVLLTILDKHAPLVSKSFKINRSPWWDTKCQEAKREMRKAQRKFNKNPVDPEAKNLFNEKCIDKAIIVDRARNSYYDQKLSSYHGNAKGTYQVVNHLLDKEFGSKKLPNGKDDETIAEGFKTFFDTKVKEIYSDIKKTSGSIKSTLNNDDTNPTTKKDSSKFSTFQEISLDDLLKLCEGISDKSCSLDIIPAWLFKKCLPEIISVIHFIVNESLRTGVFPTAFKTAVVRPSLKKHNLDSDIFGNYRPISNLTYISKLLEKVVHSQLVGFLDNEKLFSEFQSGYRKSHSCETAVLKIHNDLLIMMDKRDNAVLLLLDLSAAFDTINHSLLLKKLKDMYGITGTVLQWLKSYLENRKFKVIINQSSSSDCLLEIGVPQGSILGPLLFILYTKDIEKIVTKYGFSVHLYADDTQIYFSFDVHNPNPDLTAIKECFNEIKIWMLKNFLKLNHDKTEFMDIGYYVSPLKNLDIGGDELILSPVLAAKNLGFHFDDQLNMNAQISHLSQICYLNLRNLKRIASRLNHELKVQLVHSNILSIIDYCNAVLFGISEKNLKRIQKIQNNAVRFIFNLNGLKKYTSITPYLKKLHFLPVHYRIKFKIALMVFKCLNNLAPCYLKELIQLREPKKISMRMDNDFYLMKTPTPARFSRTDASFCQCGPKIWNELPYAVRCINEIENFKKCLKTYYFEIAFKDI